MEKRIYSIRDINVGFGHPFIDVSDMTAKRNFSFSVNAEQSMMGFSPSDYDLYFLGVFDDGKGEFKTVLPELVCHATDVFGK